MHTGTFSHYRGYSEADPPVPIPNTVVKSFNVDNTWMVTSREDRKLRYSKKKGITDCNAFFIIYY